MTTVIYDDPMRPTRLKVDSLGIGLSNDTLDTLAMSSDQYLRVGEKILLQSGTSNTRVFSLLVDNDGIGVNSTVAQRQTSRNGYAASIEGNVFIRGNVVACNVIALGGSLGIQTGGTSRPTFWDLGQDYTRNDIYYDGRITLGPEIATRTNQHKINVIDFAYRNIDYAQLSIQNTQQSRFRVGILGGEMKSPVVMNTSTGVPIEFHVGRDSNYFASIYRNGEDVPTYSNVPSAPHMCIDPFGNVCVHSNISRIVTYPQRAKNMMTNEVYFTTVTEPTNLCVEGTTYSCNILIWDYETNAAVNIDKLFVRSAGVTFKADQIIPGPFAFGDYSFRDNLTIDNSVLVRNDLRVVDTIYNANQFVSGFFTASNVEVTESAVFKVDANFNQDVIVDQSVRVRGGIVTYVPEGPNAGTWCNIQYQVANTQLSNVNYTGIGINTPGRFGTGINPRFDEVNNQLVVRKREAPIMEVELMDKTNPLYLKACYIGHPKNQRIETIRDGSTVFATPAVGNTAFDFANDNERLFQNFYFYPGKYTFDHSNLVQSSTVAPTLAINVNDCVGICKRDPVYALDVNGSIRFTADLIQGNNVVGVWIEETRAVNTGVGAPNFLGLRYSNPRCSNIGINTPPNINFALSIYGGIQSLTGYYDDQGRQLTSWINSVYGQNDIRPVDKTNISKMFTMHNVGIGVTNPTTCFVLQDNGSPTVMTMFSPGTPLVFRNQSYIQHVGLGIGTTIQRWVHGVDHETNTFQIQHHTGQQDVNLNLSSTNKALIVRTLDSSSNYQIILNGALNTTNYPNLNPSATVIVNGDMSVRGDVNITGQFRINNVPLINDNIAGSSNPLLQDTDVFISGERIYLNPINAVAVGYDSSYALFDSTNTVSKFRVYEKDPTKYVVAQFITRSDNALVEIKNDLRSAYFGFKNDLFSIFNSQQQAIFSFKENANTNESYFAFDSENQVPEAKLHVYSTTTGSNMLRLTYTSINSGHGNAPEIQLENRIQSLDSTSRKSWHIRGPDQSYNSRMSLVYSQNAFTNEVFTFTKDGYFGINNSSPEYEIDIKSTNNRGSIRLYNESTESAPQIIFQTGCNIFGSDTYRDFRICTSSNEFSIDSSDSILGSKRIIHIGGKSNYVGILSDAVEPYSLTVKGSLNVTDSLYVNGYPIVVNGENLLTLFSIISDNILLRPKVVQGDGSGGVGINRSSPSSNLFHINGTIFDANIMVLDSPLPECQIHMRSKNDAESTKFNMYRISQSNQDFTLTHLPDCGFEPHVSDSTSGYKDVFRWSPSETTVNEYDFETFGNLTMKASFPTIALATSTISDSNAHVRIMNTSNVGIGITNPGGKLHVYSHNDPSLIVTQLNATNPIASFVKNTTEVVRIANSGNVGIGTLTPSHTLHVQGDMRLTNLVGSSIIDARDTEVDINRYVEFADKAFFQNQQANCIVSFESVQKPVNTQMNYTGFGVSNNVFRYHVMSEARDHAFFANTQELVRMKGSGQVGIGTNAPVGMLHIDSSTDTTLVAKQLHASLPIASFMRSNTEVMRIINNGNVGIGTIIPTHTLHVQGTARVTDVTGSSIIDARMTQVDVNPYVEFGNRIFMRNQQSNCLVCFEASEQPNGIETNYTGFGVSNNLMRYHVSNSARDHAFFAHSNELFRIKGTGQVGIGTIAPAAMLHVDSTFDTTFVAKQLHASLPIASFMRGSTEVVRIVNNGNVGIGIISPTHTLHVQGSARLTDTSGISVLDARASQIDLNRYLELGDRLFTRNQQSNCLVCFESTDQPTGQQTAYTGFGVSNNILRYHVSNSTKDHAFFANASELVRIKGTGQLGVGTFAPAGMLHVDSSFDTTLVARQLHSSLPIASFMRSNTEVMRIINNGNVGIGIVAPTHTLHVQGTARLTDVSGQTIIDATTNEVDITRYVEFSDRVYFRNQQSNCLVCFESFGQPNGTQTAYTGFGVSNNVMRYHVSNVSRDHAFFAHSNELVRIKGTGQVGVGTFAPAAMLHVDSLFDTTLIAKQMHASLPIASFMQGSAELVRIANNGNVGIGTIATTHALHIVGNARLSDNAGAPIIEAQSSQIDLNRYVEIGSQVFTRNQQSNCLVCFESSGQPSGTQTAYTGFGVSNNVMRYHVSNSARDHAFFANTTELVRVKGTGQMGIGTFAPSGMLHIDSSSDTTIVAKQFHTSLPIASFMRSNIEVVRIINNGNVGIGTIEPSRTLHVQGTARLTDSVGSSIIDAASTQVDINRYTEFGDRLYFRNQQSNCLVCFESFAQPTGTQTSYTGFGVSNNVLRYHVSNATRDHAFFANTTELMRIRGGGNVGIGIANPASLLDVNGTITLSGIVQPKVHDASDIGTIGMRFKDSFISQSQYINSVRIQDSNGGMYVTKTTPSASLAKVTCDSIQFGSAQFSSSQVLTIEQSTSSVVRFVASNVAQNSSIAYTPLLQSSVTQCVGFGTTSPEAFVHIVNPLQNATLMLDHINNSGCNVFVARNNGAAIVTLSKTGNLGIGTSLPSSALHIQSSSTAANVVQIMTPNVTSVVHGSGNVGIGTNMPLRRLHVQGDMMVTSNVFFHQNIEVQGNTITHGDTTTDSDIRLKSDLQRIEHALDKVCTLTGYTFLKQGHAKRTTGLVAQEVEQILPECVVRHSDTDYLSIAYGNMMGLIVEAIKEIRGDLQELKSRVVSHDQQ